MSVFEVKKIPHYLQCACNGYVIAFDTETTGLQSSDDIVQLALVVMHHGKTILEKAVYLRNSIPIDGTEAQKVNGLTDDFLKREGLDPKEVFADLLSLVNECLSKTANVLLVAHNLSFDLRMLTASLDRYGLPSLPKRVDLCCTKEFVKSLNLPLHILPNNKLCTCLERLPISGLNSHDALDDARACLELFKFLTD